MRITRTAWVLILLLAAPGSAIATEASPVGEVRLEYIAHACFVVTSSAGTRVAIDPFNSSIWLGYSFPESPPPVDAVLVTHPHFDHDASYSWTNDIPVFRKPGRFGIEDIALQGVAGRHADPYGKDFGQINTIWILEVDGLRIAHLGDNGPLDETMLAELGRVDILMLPIDSTFHILKESEVEEILATLKPRYILPMHYQIPELAEEVQDLGPIEPWLTNRQHVTRIAGNTTQLSRDSLPMAPSVLIFEPSPDVKPWSEPFLKARNLVTEARVAAKAKDQDTASILMRNALELVPGSIRHSARLAGQLSSAQKKDEAIRVLERALAGAGRADWATTATVRVQLAELYRETDQAPLAEKQYRLVLDTSQRLSLRRQAQDFLAAKEIPPEWPELAGLDVFGSSQVTAEQIESRVGKRLRKLEFLRTRGAREDAQALRQAIETEIGTLGNFAYVRVSRIQYFKEGKPIYVTIDLVDAIDTESRMAFKPEPTGEPSVDPEGLLAAWQEYQRTAMSLLSEGKLAPEMPECPAFHCIAGFEHPDLENYGSLFEAKAKRHKAALKEVLSESSDFEQRRSAAYLLAHTDDGTDLVATLLPAIRDPSLTVRNAVLRVLQQVAREQRDLEIPLDPILQALDFPATTDRNKSLAVLDGLAERPDLRSEIARRAGPKLLEILALQQPNNHDYAYSILKKVSGEDFAARDEAAWKLWLETATTQ